MRTRSATRIADRTRNARAASAVSIIDTFRTLSNSVDRWKAVPVERIELPTFGLQNRCSTAELNRRRIGLAISAVPAGQDRIAQFSAKNATSGAAGEWLLEIAQKTNRVGDSGGGQCDGQCQMHRECIVRQGPASNHACHGTMLTQPQPASPGDCFRESRLRVSRFRVRRQIRDAPWTPLTCPSAAASPDRDTADRSRQNITPCRSRPADQAGHRQRSRRDRTLRDSCRPASGRCSADKRQRAGGP